MRENQHVVGVSWTILPADARSVPKPRPSAGGSGGTAAAAAAGGIVAGGAAGFLPSLIDKAGDVVNTKIIGDTIKDIGEYIVDNPWALAVIGGVVVIFIMR